MIVIIIAGATEFPWRHVSSQIVRVSLALLPLQPDHWPRLVYACRCNQQLLQHPSVTPRQATDPNPPPALKLDLEAKHLSSLLLVPRCGSF